ncbi:NTP transferase domain-containing protein [Halorubellus sp. JP-L1]|uniref:NTP transferase domain-containing protein n=1 Tax=Halorubellus sp. JP-L1 TaxID=2715753 RepID=UPI00140B8A3D|nr:NTP transferase domain-containing protein [Halorubellus sp. JP-L1]NHN42209.1 NTP transferase domain-containing protein [Halorubellus sp. JP-L1]
MCGGAGTRLDVDVEKPLFEVRGRAMVDRVVDALDAADAVGGVYAAVSPRTPATREHLAARDDVAVVDTPGDGYVADLDRALDAVGRPAVTVAADLPLLAPEHVRRALDARDRAGRERADRQHDVAADADAPNASLSVCVPVALKERLGASVDSSVDGLAPTGLNVVDTGGDTMHTTYDARLAVNVNRLADADLAAALAGPDETSSRTEGER